MNPKMLKILLSPTYETAAEKLGLNPDEIFENDGILFQQGFDTEKLNVLPGGRFRISTKFEYGMIDGDRNDFVLKTNSEEDEYETDFDENEDENITLMPGAYYFHADGVTIEKISEESDEWDYEYEEEDEFDPIEAEIIESIVESAKKRFDYENFAKELNKIDENIGSNVLRMVIENFATGEDSAHIGFKVFNEFLLLGYKWDKKQIDDFVMEKEQVFKVEIGVYQLASQMLAGGANVFSVLDFVRKMLEQKSPPIF